MGASFLMIAGGLVLLSKGDDGSQIAGSILIGSTFIGLTNLLRS